MIDDVCAGFEGASVVRTAVGEANVVQGIRSSGGAIGGVEYDFVFDVDLEDGSPMRKLGVNRGEDPMVAAYRKIVRLSRFVALLVSLT